MTKEELKNYSPKGELKGFPKEIIARMLDCQQEQCNPIDVSVFEKNKHSTSSKGGFNWYSTKEGFDFWNEVISKKNFDIFFEKYPKKDNQEPKTAKYVRVGNNAILSDYTSTESSVEINTTEDNSQEFKVGDEVIDIILDLKGRVTNVKSNGSLEIQFEGKCGITEYNLKIEKRPSLLHYRNDYNYDVIDFNNLPKRQTPKRWRAEEEGVYNFVSFDNECWFFSDDTKDDYDHFDNDNYNSGNYFCTEVEAEIIAQKLNAYMKQLIEEEHERN